MIEVPFPSGIISVSAESWPLDARSRSGGETTTGGEQVVSSGLGRWRPRLTFPLFTPERIRAFRAWLWQMDGRANFSRIGPCDLANGNQITPFHGGIPYSPDHAFHTDGAGFSQGGVPSTVSAIAAIGAMQVQIDVASVAVPVLTGTFIGFGGYLYGIVGATALPGEEALLDIRPRLRTALAVDDPVEFAHPRAPMRLLTDDSGAFELQLARTGTATLDLVEVF